MITGSNNSGRLLICIRNNTWPRTEPWGTPGSTCLGLDNILFTLTCFTLLVRYEFNQLKTLSMIPNNLL